MTHFLRPVLRRNTRHATALRALCALLMLLLLGLTATGGANPATAPEETIHVLLLEARPGIDDTLRERLAEQGIQIVLQRITDPLTEEMLGRFHVVVLAAFHGVSVESFFILPHHILQQQLALQGNMDLLQSYAQAGGGLLVMPYMLGSGTGTALKVSEFLEPFGARLHPLQVRDPEHLFEPHFAWTDAVTQHPATEAVRTIFYPHNMLRWDDAYATPTLELLDPEWTALVRGMPVSAGAVGFDYTKWEPTELMAPPIAAVREIGNGRVGLLAVNNHYVFRFPFRSVPRGWIGEANVGDIDGVFMEKGDGETPSDGFALVSGMLHWLGGSASEAGMGGYDQEEYAALPRPALPPVPRWLQTWTPDSGALPHQVLIGARSAFSDGAGTVAEYARAARDAGLSLLIMTETFEHFDPDRWPEFVDACDRASDAELTVIPGVDIADQHGTRYLYFGKGMAFPKPSLLTPDGRQIEKTQYFSLGLGVGVMVAHRIGSQLHHPHQLLKHYYGISVYTYRDGQLVDDAREAYAWQIDAYSNPMPFVTHEVYAPDRLQAAAGAGHQLYVMAPDPATVAWYLGEVSGLAHFYEMPLRMQISAGPLMTEFLTRNFVKLESDVPLREVRLYDHGDVLRRWTPAATTFTLPRVKLPDGHKTWTHLVAEDELGQTMVSPGILSGRNSKWGYTWRCGDRQNWTHPFVTIYTGQEIFHFGVNVPGAAQAGDLAAVNEFRLSSWPTYIQESSIAYCYPDAGWEAYARDAKPVPRTERIEGYRGRARFHQFYHPDTINWMRPHAGNMPTLKKIELELLQPLQAQGDIFPHITQGGRSDASGEPTGVGNDRTYVYRDPESGQEIAGELTEGYIDLPDGGRIGGLIALSDGLRIDTRGNIGFAAPQDGEELLPAGTQWSAAFVTVKPEVADHYRRMMGLSGPTPYALDLSQGELERIQYVAYCRAQNGGLHGTVSEAWDEEYLLPVALSAVNPNWDAALWRPGFFRPIPIFEGEAWARLDVGEAGEFYMGHTLMSDVNALHLGLLHWSADRIEFEVHNPTDEVIEAEVWTAPAISDRKPYRASLSVPAGTSRVIAVRQNQ